MDVEFGSSGLLPFLLASLTIRWCH